MRKPVLYVADNLKHLAELLTRNKDGNSPMAKMLKEYAEMLEEAAGANADHSDVEAFDGMPAEQLSDKLLKIQEIVCKIKKSSFRVMTTSLEDSSVHRARDICGYCSEIFKITGIMPKPIETRNDKEKKDG